MNAVEILEQAVNLLRGAPPAAFLCYLNRAVPVAVARLLFLNDMNRSPFAFDHLAAGSAAVAALYLWKNSWQAVFARKLYLTLSPNQPRLSVARTVLLQSALQPAGLALALPLPWLMAFFRNAQLIGALGWPHPLRAARRQAGLWSGQNWGILALVSVGGLLLFANIVITIAALPQLARSFLGMEGEFARIGIGILNLPTLAAAAMLTWLVVDPLLDAVYVLRCFYGQSVATGEDLRAALRRSMAATALLAALLAIGLLMVTPGRATAQVRPSELDHSIDRVIHSREFTWRTPRPPGEAPHGRWVGWIRSVENLVADGWQWVKQTVRRFFERSTPQAKKANDLPVTRRELEGMIAVVGLAGVAAALVFFLRARPAVVAATPVTMAARAADLADESVTADQMPESSWLRLADDWLEKGDFRLALRALYLAGLNYLGGRNLVSIRRSKSGRDYTREVSRRARENPEIPSLFSKNVDIFERGWYGVRPVERDMVESFASGLTEIRRKLERS